MQQLRNQNVLLLQLVSTLQKQVNSKSKENSFIYQELQGLQQENSQLLHQLHSQKISSRRSSSITSQEKINDQKVQAIHYAYHQNISEQNFIEELQKKVSELQKNILKKQEYTDQVKKQLQNAKQIIEALTKSSKNLNEKVQKLRQDQIQNRRQNELKQKRLAQLTNNMLIQQNKLDQFRQESIHLINNYEMQLVEKTQKINYLQRKLMEEVQKNASQNKEKIKVPECCEQKKKKNQNLQQLQRLLNENKDLKQQLEGKSKTMTELFQFQMQREDTIAELEKQIKRLSNTTALEKEVQKIEKSTQNLQQLQRLFNENKDLKQQLEGESKKNSQLIVLIKQLNHKLLNEQNSSNSIAQRFQNQMNKCMLLLKSKQEQVIELSELLNEQITKETQFNDQNKLNQLNIGSTSDQNAQEKGSSNQIVKNSQIQQQIQVKINTENILLQKQNERLTQINPNLQIQLFKLNNRCADYEKEIIELQEKLTQMASIIVDMTEQAQKMHFPEEELNIKIKDKVVEPSQIREIDRQSAEQIQALDVSENEMHQLKGKQSEDQEKERMIEMLNAVIDNIKSQHEESITMLEKKNQIITDLERKCQQIEESYNSELFQLRNSIAAVNKEQFRLNELVSSDQSSPNIQHKNIDQMSFKKQQFQSLQEDRVFSVATNMQENINLKEKLQSQTETLIQNEIEFEKLKMIIEEHYFEMQVKEDEITIIMEKLQSAKHSNQQLEHKLASSILSQRELDEKCKQYEAGICQMEEKINYLSEALLEATSHPIHHQAFQQQKQPYKSKIEFVKNSNQQLQSKNIRQKEQSSLVEVDITEIREKSESETNEIKVLHEIMQRYKYENEELSLRLDDKLNTVSHLEGLIFRIETGYNSEIMSLRREIAESNRQVIGLRKQIYLLNSPQIDLTAFLKESFKPNAKSQFYRGTYPKLNQTYSADQNHALSFSSNQISLSLQSKHLIEDRKFNLGEKFMGKKCNKNTNNILDFSKVESDHQKILDQNSKSQISQESKEESKWRISNDKPIFLKKK